MKRVKILASAAGGGFAVQTGEIVEVTPRNADWLEGLVRGGLATDADEKKKAEAGGPGENPDLLYDLSSPASRSKYARRPKRRGVFRYVSDERQPLSGGAERPVPKSDGKLEQDAGDGPVG